MGGVILRILFRPLVKTNNVKRKINALDFYNKYCETPKSNITYAVENLDGSVKEKERMIK